MTLKPLGDRVLIKPDEPVKLTESGLHLVEDRKPENSGIVVALGEPYLACPHCEGVIHPQPEVAVGDTVVFSWAVGQEILIDDERYLLMKESDISAVLEGA